MEVNKVENIVYKNIYEVYIKMKERGIFLHVSYDNFSVLKINILYILKFKKKI